MAFTEKNYIDLMTPWLSALPQFLRQSSVNPELRYYGTGESKHWPTQSNMNVFAAMAVLGTSKYLESGKRDEVLQTALDLFRYTLNTHLSGKLFASDGMKWGHSWISVLGVERMSHGVNAIRPYLNDEDLENLRNMLISESSWIVDEHPLRAGMDGTEGKNVPESNIWNGAVLLRTAMEYPDAPRVNEYLDKATAFLLNGLSHCMDAGCENKFRGKPVRKWHTGFNFTPNWSLDHHCYMNVGYMVISLSNLAMLHFYLKERGFDIPGEVYWHVREVWDMVKRCTFADGRLLRIGGDTRARYTYCQNYAIPVWFLAEDHLQDADAANFEKGWLSIVKKDMDFTGDGGFYGGRLANIKRDNYFYYSRLESDAILCLSYGAYWRRKFQMPQPAREIAVNPPALWQDEFHGATFVRDANSVRSFVWRSGQGPTGVIAPADESSLAEWQNNLHGQVLSTLAPALKVWDDTNWHQLFEGGFVNAGQECWHDTDPGEGESIHEYAVHKIAVAALPDGKSMIVLELAKMTFETTLAAVKGICVKIPNDIFNGSKRIYVAQNGRKFTKYELDSNPGVESVVELGSKKVSVDGKLSIAAVYGTESLRIHRPASQTIVVKKQHAPWLTSLYVDEICGEIRQDYHRWMPGDVVIDDGFVISVSAVALECRKPAVKQPAMVRSAQVVTEAGTFTFIANFGDSSTCYNPPQNGRLIAGSLDLAPNTAALWQQE